MSLLQTLQSECVSYLSAQDYFVGPPVISVIAEDLHDIDSQVNVQLARIGLGVIVRTPTAVDVVANLTPPYFQTINLRVDVVENVTVNRSGSTPQTSSKVAEAVAYFLHLYRPSGTGECLFCKGIQLQDSRQTLTYQVNFQTQGGLASSAPTRS
jgi:hypothetical protein